MENPTDPHDERLNGNIDKHVPVLKIFACASFTISTGRLPAEHHVQNSTARSSVLLHYIQESLSRLEEGKGRSIIRSSSDLDCKPWPAFLAKREDYLSSYRQPR